MKTREGKTQPSGGLRRRFMLVAPLLLIAAFLLAPAIAHAGLGELVDDITDLVPDTTDSGSAEPVTLPPGPSDVGVTVPPVEVTPPGITIPPIPPSSGVEIPGTAPAPGSQPAEPAPSSPSRPGPSQRPESPSHQPRSPASPSHGARTTTPAAHPAQRPAASAASRLADTARHAMSLAKPFAAPLALATLALALLPVIARPSRLSKLHDDELTTYRI